jgi:hypothetical protein
MSCASRSGANSLPARSSATSPPTNDVAGLSAQLALVFEQPRDSNVDHRFTPTQQQAFRTDLECELARLLDWFRRRAWPDLRWIEHLFVQGLIQLQICKMPPKAVA